MTRITGSILLLVAVLTIAACEAKPTPVPRGTTADPAADPAMKAEVTSSIMVVEKLRAPTCADPEVVNTAIVQKRADGGSAVERWTIDRCGKAVNYRVTYNLGDPG